MATNANGGFRPPAVDNVLWKCTECKTFNKADASVCKKCGTPKEQAADSGISNAVGK